MRILKDIISVTDDVGNPGEDTTLVSEKGVRNAIAEGAGLLHNVEADKNPSLGGDLDMNGFNVGGSSEEQLDDTVAKKHTKLCDAADFTKLDGIEAGATKTDVDSIGDFVHWSGSKTTPVDADETGLLNSAGGWVLKKVTWANIKATLKTYFDTLYSAVGAVMGTDFNAKGDLLSASADDTPVILPVGVNDKVLTADSAEASGLKWADAGGGGAPDAHKDSHDPQDGSDPLDTAVAAEITGVQAAGVGTSHSLARADHAHQIQHGIGNNHLVTIDHAAVADNDYARFTASGLEGREASEVLGDIGAPSTTTANWSKSIGAGGDYATWAAMIADMPDLIAHTVTVTIEDGTTLTEVCNLKNKHGLTTSATITAQAEKYFPTSGAIPTADSATATTLRDAALATAALGNDYFNGCWVFIVHGTGTDNGFVSITDYVDANGDIVVASWPGTQPDNTSRYLILGALVNAVGVNNGFYLLNNTVPITLKGIGVKTSNWGGFSSGGNFKLLYQYCGAYGNVRAGMSSDGDIYSYFQYGGIVNNNTINSAVHGGAVCKNGVRANVAYCGISDNKQRGVFVRSGQYSAVGANFGNLNGTWGTYADSSGQAQCWGSECSGSSGKHYTGAILDSIDLGEHGIKLDSLLSANAKYSGITCDGVLGATSAVGDLVYLNEADARWELADADAEATSGDVMLAIVLAAGVNGDTRLLLLQGFVRLNAWNFTSYGHALFVSCTAGDMTATAPSGSADIVRVVGYASTFADQIYFNPSKTWLEIA